MAYHTATRMTTTINGITTWDPSQSYALRGEPNDSNGVQLKYNIDRSNYWYKAEGTDGQTYIARYSYIPSRSPHEMYPDESSKDQKSSWKNSETFWKDATPLIIVLIGIATITTLGIIISQYVKFVY